METDVLEKLNMALNSHRILGVKKYTESNFEIMNFVRDELSKYDIKEPNFKENRLHRSELINSGIRSFMIYGQQMWLRILGIYTMSQLVLMVEPCSFATNIEFEVEPLDNEKNFIDKKSGHVNHFKVSDTMCVSDCIWYGHEGIHACKDTNYNEYINMCKYGDVLPIFHELLTCNNYGNDVFNEWLNVRYHFLKLSSNELQEGIDMKNKDKNNSDAYDLLIGTSGQYLTSFYYAMVLYQYYLKDKRILDYIIRVLDNKITTYDLLSQVGLLNRSKNIDNIFIESNKSLINKIRG